MDFKMIKMIRNDKYPLDKARKSLLFTEGSLKVENKEHL